MYQVGKLQALHTTNHGTVIVKFLITRTHTVDDAYCFRRGLAIAQNHVTGGGSRGIGQPFKLQAREYIWQSSITIVTDLPSTSNKS